MPAAKLWTANEPAEMARLYRDEQISIRKLAKRFGVSKQTVRRILGRAAVTFRAARERCRRYEVNERAFDDPTDPDTCYFLGLLMTDGNVFYHPSGQTATITLSLKRDDIGHVLKFRAFLGANYPIATVPGRLVRGLNHNGVARSAPQARLAVTSKPLADALARYGVVPRKSATAEVRLIQDSPDFWRGCVDGDGSLYITERPGGHFRIHVALTGSPQLLGQFAGFISSRLGRESPKLYGLHRTSVARALRIGGRSAFQMIKLLYGSGHVSLDRKQAIADLVLNRPELYCPAEPKRYWYRGEPRTLVELANIVGIRASVLLQRLGTHGWSVERAVTTPVRLTSRTPD